MASKHKNKHGKRKTRKHLAKNLSFYQVVHTSDYKKVMFTYSFITGDNNDKELAYLFAVRRAGLMLDKYGELYSVVLID